MDGAPGASGTRTAPGWVPSVGGEPGLAIFPSRRTRLSSCTVGETEVRHVGALLPDGAVAAHGAPPTFRRDPVRMGYWHGGAMILSLCCSFRAGAVAAHGAPPTFGGDPGFPAIVKAVQFRQSATQKGPGGQAPVNRAGSPPRLPAGPDSAGRPLPRSRSRSADDAEPGDRAAS